MKKHYIVNPKEETIGEIKKWHSIVASAEVEYKEELNRLWASHGKDHVLFCKLSEEINKKEENENRININCTELDKFFVYESISIDEYTKVKGQKSFPTFIGFNQNPLITCQAFFQKSFRFGKGVPKQAILYIVPSWCSIAIINL